MHTNILVKLCQQTPYQGYQKSGYILPGNTLTEAGMLRHVNALSGFLNHLMVVEMMKDQDTPADRWCCYDHVYEGMNNKVFHVSCKCHKSMIKNGIAQNHDINVHAHPLIYHNQVAIEAKTLIISFQLMGKWKWWTHVTLLLAIVWKGTISDFPLIFLLKHLTLQWCY